MTKPALSERIQLKDMTREQARVAVAQDVLKWLDSKKLIATSGTYVCLKNPDPINDDEDAREFFSRKQGCEVCAIGATFIAAVDRFDALTIGDLAYSTWGSERDFLSDEMREYLMALFSMRELEALEDDFEHIWRRETEPSSETKMRAIMQSIIDSNGGPYTRINQGK